LFVQRTVDACDLEAAQIRVAGDGERADEEDEKSTM
jgi:hypothetical protein